MTPRNDTPYLLAVLLLAILLWLLGSAIPARPQTLEHWAGSQWKELSAPEKKAFAGGLLAGLWWGVQAEYVAARQPAAAIEFRALVESLLAAYKDNDIVAALNQCYEKPTLVGIPIVPVLVELRKQELLITSQRRTQ